MYSLGLIVGGALLGMALGWIVGHLQGRQTSDYWYRRAMDAERRACVLTHEVLRGNKGA